MTARLARKRATRERRKLRRELVHSAGCTFRGNHTCASIDCLPELLAEALMAGIRVPRSLRHIEPEAPIVCPGCFAVGAEPCAPGCIDDEIRRESLYSRDEYDSLFDTEDEV